MSNPSWQPWQQGRVQGGFPQPWPGQAVVPSASSSLLASHADRERAVDVLRAGYAEGRLGQPEFDDRVARAYTARTLGELSLLVADLPQGPALRPDAVPQTFLPPPPPKTNEKAVGALICGLLCLPTAGLTGIPAVVLGHAARAEIRRRGEAGDGLALTGLVLGWLSTAGWALVLVLFLALALVSV
ncbi:MULTISPECIES: DUF1707 and DUF4190 domain-containing protein [unclassified Streptomyces]|uniref:DUF1707 and DUF4190 domain-containing protein n=1 Tax=unclassified Streptomyces TaxID=2593676 RepID=UPI0033A6BC70